MSNKLFVFTANWCGPCKNLKSTLLKLKEQFPDLVELKDIDDADTKPLLSKYGVGAVPTLVLVDTALDKELKRSVGATTYSQLLELIGV